jgi:hypothetical protein
VILRILAQESLDLELWLKRYDVLKFQGLFCKIPRINEFRLIFELKQPWTESMGHGPQEPWSTVDRPPLLVGLHCWPLRDSRPMIKGRGRGSGARGTQWAAHWRLSGGEVVR